MNVNVLRTNDQAQTFCRRIGKTSFRVRVFQSENATETMEERFYGLFAILSPRAAKNVV